MLLLVGVDAAVGVGADVVPPPHALSSKAIAIPNMAKKLVFRCGEDMEWNLSFASCTV
jgi:hypothetical protein